VLSDHADWPGLLRSVRDCGARQVYLTHGQQDVLARYLREVEGLAAEPLRGELASRPDLEAQLDVEPDGTHTSSPSSASP
jgi:putative mRNA 3-end processing factor